MIDIVSKLKDIWNAFLISIGTVTATLSYNDIIQTIGAVVGVVGLFLAASRIKELKRDNDIAEKKLAFDEKVFKSKMKSKDK